MPFLPREEELLAIRNQALYGVFDPEHKQIVGLEQDLFVNQTDEKGQLIRADKPYLKKQTRYKVNEEILAFLIDIIMEVIDCVKVNDAIAEYYGIEESEISAIKNLALRLSLLIMEPSVAAAYGYPTILHAVIDNYKMKVLTYVYAGRHQHGIGLDFTLPKLSNEKEFAAALSELAHNKDLETDDDEKFADAFEKKWRHLQNYSDGRFGFVVIPKLNYGHFKRYLDFMKKQGLKIDSKVRFQLINYLGFSSKINPSFGLSKAYKKLLIEAFLPIAKSKAQIISQIIEKNLLDREKMEEWLRKDLEAVIKAAVDDYDPLFFWEKIEKKNRHFVWGDIHATTDREKFKIIPITGFVDKKVMRELMRLRKEGIIQDDHKELIPLDDNLDYEEDEDEDTTVNLTRGHNTWTTGSIENLFKDKLLVIEEFADLVLKEVDDSRLDEIKEPKKFNLVKRLRHWDKTGIFKPRKRSRKKKIRFYHREQAREIPEALDRAEMNRVHKTKGLYNLKEAKEKINFKKSINTFCNRIKDLIRIGKLPKDVKKLGSYAFNEEQMEIITKELK
jgi:DNA-binding transcriptional regulator YhcF (GntR family)